MGFLTHTARLAANSLSLLGIIEAKWTPKFRKSVTLTCDSKETIVRASPRFFYNR